jgi:hypothetical protein
MCGTRTCRRARCPQLWRRLLDPKAWPHGAARWAYTMCSAGRLRCVCQPTHTHTHTRGDTETHAYVHTEA